MKQTRRILCLMLIFCLISAMAATASAESIIGASWSVGFDGRKITETYPTEVNLAQNIQPGDDLTQVITQTNNSKYTTLWYMENQVIKSLEQASSRNAYGGAYSYKLVYESNGKTRDLFNSDTVGGDTADNKGMAVATQGLEDYVFLGELAPGATGTVTLKMAVDGRSQINRYQNTNAKVRMRFAVEVKENPKIVKSVETGDWMQTMPFIVLTAVSGTALLGMAIVWVRKPKKADRGPEA